VRVKEQVTRAKLDGSLTGKRAFLKLHFFMKYLSDGEILVTFLILKLDRIISPQCLMGI